MTCSHATEHTAEIYKKARTVLISPVSTAVRCPLDENGDPIKSEPEGNGDPIKSEPEGECLELNDYVFRTSIDERKAIDKLLGYVNRMQGDTVSINKIAIIYEENSRYSRLYKKAFISLVRKLYPDGEDLKVINPDDDTTDDCNVTELESFDPDSCFGFIQENNADTLLLIPSTKNNYWVEVAIEQNRAKASDGKRPYSLLGSDSMYQQGFIRINDKYRSETEGMLIPISWHRTLFGDENECNKVSEEFECRAAEFVNESDEDGFKSLGVNWRTATSYDAAKALFVAIEDASQSTNCRFLARYIGRRSACIKSVLQEELKGVNISGNDETSFGGISFDDKGDRTGIEGVVVDASQGNFIIAPKLNR